MPVSVAFDRDQQLHDFNASVTRYLGRDFGLTV